MTTAGYADQRSINRRLGAYQSQTVETASPAKLITMLYDGALRAVAAARIAIDAGQLETSHSQLVKAQAIVTELSASLNMADGGQIARSLADLYDFCHERLVRANVEKSTVHLRPVEQVITELRDAWNEMSGQNAV